MRRIATTRRGRECWKTGRCRERCGTSTRRGTRIPSGTFWIKWRWSAGSGWNRITIPFTTRAGIWTEPSARGSTPSTESGDTISFSVSATPSLFPPEPLIRYPIHIPYPISHIQSIFNLYLISVSQIHPISCIHPIFIEYSLNIHFLWMQWMQWMMMDGIHGEWVNSVGKPW